MIQINSLPPLEPSKDKSHHVGSPRTGFQNPWPSFNQMRGGPVDLLKTRFIRDKPPFVPVPADRQGLPRVLKSDFTPPHSGFKVTWLGHAGFIIQTSSLASERGFNVLCDPVFSERTSPFSFFGPKRYTAAPCTIAELCDALIIDAICISHNHYDHADTNTLKYIHDHQPHVLFLVGLNNTRWLTHVGIHSTQIRELDWWDRLNLAHPASDISLTITCTPTQHFSARWINDRNHDLWCSYAFHLPSSDSSAGKSLYFAGDTGYRSVPSTLLPKDSHAPTASTPQQVAELAALPIVPAFATIGQLLGPFDLALLPIGLCNPRDHMSPVHCNAEDSFEIHKAIKSKRSVGMHWGTVRGGLSGVFEDVKGPPGLWRRTTEGQGRVWRGRGPGQEGRLGLDCRDGKKKLDEEAENEGWECGLMDVGESLVV